MIIKKKPIQIKKHYSWFFLVTFFPLWTSQSFTADTSEPRMITECVFSYCHCCFVSGPELELEWVTAARDGAPLLSSELLQAVLVFWFFFLTQLCLFEWEAVWNQATCSEWRTTQPSPPPSRRALNQRKETTRKLTYSTSDSSKYTVCSERILHFHPPWLRDLLLLFLLLLLLLLIPAAAAAWCGFWSASLFFNRGLPG